MNDKLSEMQTGLRDISQSLELEIKQNLKQQAGYYKQLGLGFAYADLMAKATDIQEAIKGMMFLIQSKKENQTAVKAA